MRLRLRLWVRIHLEVKDLKVQINVPQSCQQGDNDDGESQLLRWAWRLGLTEKSSENIWIRIGEELFLNHCMPWQIPEQEEDAGAGNTETEVVG